MTLLLSFLLLAVAVASLVLALGAFQKDPGDWCSAGVVGLVIGLAVLGAVMLSGTEFFYVAALAVAAVLLLHHTVIHWVNNFAEREDEPCGCACFQLKDVRNHETWVVASIVAAVVSATHA